MHGKNDDNENDNDNFINNGKGVIIMFTIIISIIKHLHEISTNHKMIQLCRHCEAKFMFNPRSTSTSLFTNMTTLHHKVIYLFDSYLISNGFLRDEF